MRLQHAVLALILVVASSLAWAGGLTPKRYVDIEILVRSSTLDQLKEKVSGEETDKNYTELVRTIYELYGVTSGEHLRYGNKYQKDIDQWLTENTSKKDELERLQMEFSQLIEAAEGQSDV